MPTIPARRVKQRPAKAATARKLAEVRFEARLTNVQKQQLQRAAEVSGARSPTEFVISSAEAEARRVLQEHDVIRLSREGQRAFVTALLAPRAPNAKLQRAAAAYRELMGP